MGFELGIKNSKWKDKLECIACSEIDKYAKSIYSRHYTHTHHLDNICEVRTEELPEFDLLVGGFPCQSFSNEGKKRGFDDTRGTLFFEIARILSDKRPKYFLLENVKGLLYHDSGETFKTVLKVLSDLGYNVEWKIYNSENYGVPQKRERLYIKGYSRRKCGSEILSFRETLQRVDDKPRRIEDEKREIHIKNNTKKGYIEANCYDGINYTFVYSNNRRGRVQHNKTGTLNTSGGWGVSDENYNIRKLTPEECEVLQGFPREYTKYGVNGELIPITQRYKCIGNAVTTNVITHIFNNWDLQFDEE